MRSEVMICDKCYKTVSIPIEGDEKKNWFHADGYFCRGDFCSLSCMVAYYSRMLDARITEEKQQKKEGK